MQIPPFITKYKSQLITTIVLLLILLSVWLFVAVTKIGITPDIAFWNEAGVPLLALQILSALGISLGLGWILSLPRFTVSSLAHKSIGKFLLVDLILALAIWGLAAGIWLAEPQEQSFNAPRPSPPTYEFYPYSDSTAYDLGAQYALIGQGLNNDLPSDKPLYLFFLAIFHLIGGQSVKMTIAVQILALAIFPVILFFLGKDIHSRGVGIFVALLVIFKERNAIASALDIQVSHVKLMMTEVPTALLVSIVTVMIFKWWKNSNRSGSLPIWIGGVIGAAALMRTNAFLLLPLAFLIPFFARGQTWRERIFPALSVLLGFLLFVLPWFLTNRGPDGRTFLESKLNGILERYQKYLPSGSGLDLPSLPHLAMLSDETILTEVHLNPFNSRNPRPVFQMAREEMTALQFIPAHFFHNQIAAVFILPTTWKFRGLTQTVVSPLWEKNWSGALTFENATILFLNLSLLALGLALAWRRWRGAGFVPALVEIFYYLANALARTSGSRYLVPVDWVVYFYYALGLFQLAEWMLELITKSERLPISETISNDSVALPRNFWIAPVSVLLILGLLLPLPSFVVPQRYPSFKKAEAYQLFREQVSLTDLGFSQQEIRSFIRHPDAFVFQGRLLYPRYFIANDGLCKRCYVLDAAFGSRPYHRFTFIALGPTSAGVIVEMPSLPDNFRSVNFPSAPDVWVVGCKDHTEYFGILKNFQSAVRGLVIAISGKNGLQIYAPPNVRLTCN